MDMARLGILAEHCSDEEICNEYYKFLCKMVSNWMMRVTA